ncbi:hypothetical protein MMC25_002656 [Agyrium rufum]|nr:hypothetical protein [Agyrium rufum]
MSHIVDVHTHMYPPSYIELLSNRTTVPYIHKPRSSPSPPSSSSSSSHHNNGTSTRPAPPRLIILPSDDNQSVPPSQRGRPIDDSYSSIEHKRHFMRAHSIRTSVLSLANPWLDFLEPEGAAEAAIHINADFESLCAARPAGQLFFLGTLPLSAPMQDILKCLATMTEMPHMRGLIMGTTGLGKGLDDPALDELWSAIEKASLTIFIHPHYGLPKDVFGPLQEESGHVLPLALGFPLETTIAFTRMYLAGVFDRFAKLKILLAHAGGAVPFLIGRLESCVLHERKFRDAKGAMMDRRGIWDVMRRNVWLDGVIYSEVGLEAAVTVVGKERVLFGTDHPFFPPLQGDGNGNLDVDEDVEMTEWASVKMNVDAIRGCFTGDAEGAGMVLGGNARKLFGLEEKRS